MSGQPVRRELGAAVHDGIGDVTGRPPSLRSKTAIDPLRGPRVAVLFERFGPYHVSRLSSAASEMKITGVEFTGTDKTYAWESTEGLGSFPRHVISSDINRESSRQLVDKMSRTLTAIDPNVVAIPGWFHPGALAALLWCRRSGTPAVLMSDSTSFDEVRRPWKEAIKQRVVSQFGGALVAGAPHRQYLRALGMPDQAIFEGFDVVDNDHFSRQASLARSNAADLRARVRLPERYFLSVSRFIQKKNLFRLLLAFEAYRHRAGPEAWHLVLVGDGELQTQLVDWVNVHGLDGVVHMPGFNQYGELPTYYGLASAFILASTTEQWGLVVNEAMAAGLPVLVSNRCGCAPDLVVNGRNGFVFDPLDPEELRALMLQLTSEGCDRQKMSEEGRRLIAEWTPVRFARNLRLAAEFALAGSHKGRAADRLLLRALILRGAGSS